MPKKPEHKATKLGDPQLDRLVRDLRALGRLDPSRQTAAERLTTLLGADLLAAIFADLRDLDVTTIPLATRPRRVA
jgi:hypothetical protein